MVPNSLTDFTFDLRDSSNPHTVAEVYRFVGIASCQKSGNNEKLYLFAAKEVETRWKNVRDGFMKYRRKLKTRSGDGAKTLKEYKYANVMSFLIPYLDDRPTSGNLGVDSHDDEDDDDDTQQETSNGWKTMRIRQNLSQSCCNESVLRHQQMPM